MTEPKIRGRDWVIVAVIFALAFIGCLISHTLVLQLFFLILICCLVSMGFYSACQFDGDEFFDDLPPDVQQQEKKPDKAGRMLLWWVRFYGAPILGTFWRKPVYYCPACMGSLHSIAPTYMYLSFIGFPGLEILMVWPFIALGTCGINHIIQVWWNKS